MRPPKQIVIVDPHEDRRGILRFTLWAKMLNALGAASITEARDVIANSTQETDLILGYWPIDESWFAALGAEFHIPTIYVADTIKATPLHVADATLDSKVRMVELFERIKIMAARMRGPAKGSTHKPKEVQQCQNPNQSEKFAAA